MPRGKSVRVQCQGVFKTFHLDFVESKDADTEHQAHCRSSASGTLACLSGKIVSVF